MNNWDEIDTYVREWLEEAREKILASFSTSIEIETKSDRNDLVTNIDKEIEQFFIQHIKNKFPDHHILGEEGLGEKIDCTNGMLWIVDPIDGTVNFVHQQRNFMISIGIYENGVGKLGYIYDVIHKELYHAVHGEGAYFNDVPIPKLTDAAIENAIVGLNPTWVVENRKIDPKKLSKLVKDVRAIRCYGSAALEIAYVATGRLDAYITMRLSPWDFAAGKVIIEEVGGIMTDIKGEPLKILENSPVFVSKPSLHETILNKYLKEGSL